MACVLAEVAKPQGITCCEHVSTTTNQLIVAARHASVDFYAANASEKFEIVDSLPSPLPVMAMAHSDRYLVLLTSEYRLLFFELGSPMECVRNLKLDMRGQQPCLDKPPMVMALKEGFLVHCFQGIVLIFTVEEDSKKRKRGDGCTSSSYSIGSVVVQSMAVIPAGDYDIVAILYRDFNFNFSLRYYEADTLKKRFTMVKQFAEFAEPVNYVLAPPVGGILVFSVKHVFYFSSPDIGYLELSNDNRDPMLSVGRENHTVTSTLTSTMKPIQCATIIDGTRYLFITKDGSTYVMLFQATNRQSTVSLQALSILSLGKSTIATGVHHLSGSLFFASSKLSQSHFFHIHTTAPHISVDQVLPSSPPILDISIGHNGRLLSCQGGVDSGELCNFVGKITRLRVDLPVEASNGCLNAVAMAFENNSVIYGLYSLTGELTKAVRLDKNQTWEAIMILNKDLLLLSANVPVVLRTSVIDNGEERATLKSKVFSSTMFAYVDSEGQFFMKRKDAFEHRVLLHSPEVSLFDVQELSDSRYIILAGFWDGSYAFYEADTEEIDLCYKDKLAGEIVDCTLVYDNYRDKRTIWAFFTTTRGELVQVNFDWANGKPCESKTTSSKLSSFPLSISSKDGTAIVHRENTAYVLEYDLATQFFVPKTLTTDRNFFYSDLHLLDNETLLVLSRSKMFVMSGFESDKFSPKTLYGNHLCLKAVMFQDCCVVLCRENSGDKNYFLQLVSLDTLTEVFRLELDASEAVDLLALPECEDIPENAFLVLLNNSEQSIIQCYEVQSNTIRWIPTHLQGVDNVASLSVTSICLVSEPELMFAVSGNMDFAIRLLPYSDKLVWQVIRYSVKAGHSLAFVTGLKDKYVCGDMMGELKLYVPAEGNFVMSSLEQEYKPSFLSALSMVCENDERTVFVGDSLGNLSASLVHESTLSTTFASNIGQQVNVIRTLADLKQHEQVPSLPATDPLVEQQAIIGTAEGGIYCISSLKGDDTVDGTQLTLAKCQAELVAFQETLDSPKTKGAKYTAWTSRHDWRYLHCDDSGNRATKPSVGLLDSTLMRQWLELDSNLRSYDQRGEPVQKRLDSMAKALKTCYKHKPLVQRVVHEARYTCT